MAAAGDTAPRLAAGEPSELTLREVYRRKAEASASWLPAGSKGAAAPPGHPDVLQKGKHAHADPGSPAIGAFRPPRSPAKAPQPQLPFVTGNLYRTANAPAATPAATATAGPQHLSPEAPPSELSTVHRAINAAIANSVELMLASPPQAGAPPPQPQQSASPAWPLRPPAQPRSQPDGSCAEGSLVSISPYGFMELGSGGAVRPRSSGGAELPVPPAEPAHPSQPCMTESYAMELQAALSPAFMTSRSRAIFCELDDPGSGIHFPKNRSGTRLQRFLGRLRSCFVPEAELAAERRMRGGGISTPVAGGARPDQSPSPQLPTKLAIPLEPLRSSMVGLRGGPEDPALAAWEQKTAALQAALSSSPRARPHLGLREEESADLINIASPPPPPPGGLHSQPASECGVGGEGPTTPIENLFTTNLLTARGEAEGAQQGGCHAKRDLMELLRSRAEGMVEAAGGLESLLQQQQQQQQEVQQHPAGLAAWLATLTAAAAAAAAVEEEEAEEVTLCARPRVGSDGEEVCQRAPQASAPPAAVGQRESQSAEPSAADACGIAPTLAQTARLELAERQGSSSEEPPPQAAATARQRKASSPKSPGAKRTAVTLSQLLAKRRGSPGSAGKKRRQQQKQQQQGARVANKQAADPRLLQAARQLELAKLAANRQRPASSAGQRSLRGNQPTAAAAAPAAPAAAAPPGRRDLSKPAYRSERLHAILSPAKPLCRQQTNHGSLTAVLPLGSASAPVSPFKQPSLAAAAAGATSLPASPMRNPLLQPQIQPRMNRTSSVRAAAVQQKHKQQQEQQHVVGKAGTGAALVSPERTARPHYTQRSSTPAAARLPVFAPGEAGVEPYSAQRAAAAVKATCAPLLEGGAAGGTGPSTWPAAAAAAGEGSPVSLAKYQADRADYLQMLQQLALGMELSNPLALQREKEPTPPPVPAELLEGSVDDGLQAGRESRLGWAAGAAVAGPRAGGTGAAAAIDQAPGWYAALAAQRRAASEQENSGLTNRTLVYSIGSSHSSELSEGSGLAAHSNELFGQELTSPGRAAPARNGRCSQQMVSLSTAVQRALSSKQEEARPASRTSAPREECTQAGGSQGDCRTDESGGRGAVAAGAGGQQTVSKLLPSRRRSGL